MWWWTVVVVVCSVLCTPTVTNSIILLGLGFGLSFLDKKNGFLVFLVVLVDNDVVWRWSVAVVVVAVVVAVVAVVMCLLTHIPAQFICICIFV